MFCLTGKWNVIESIRYSIVCYLSRKRKDNRIKTIFVESKNMGDRPRIKRKTNTQQLIVDPLAFTVNKATSSGRKISEYSVNINFEIWEDKHLAVRRQHGDDLGKREGIDKETVSQLVKDSFPFLIHFSITNNRFSFISPSESLERKKRVILQKGCDDLILLNVVVECHLLDITKYEMTIITAMKINGFSVSDGQFVLRLFTDGASLNQNQKGTIQEIDTV